MNCKMLSKLVINLEKIQKNTIFNIHKVICKVMFWKGGKNLISKGLLHGMGN